MITLDENLDRVSLLLPSGPSTNSNHKILEIKDIRNLTFIKVKAIGIFLFGYYFSSNPSL